MSAEVIAHLTGDYVLQTDHMAREKGRSKAVALLHGAEYAACFLPLTRDPRALAAIGLTHAAIDHWRLARHLVWAKNQAAPAAHRYPWSEAGPWGYREGTPDWLGGWLLFIADNTCHLAINRLALARWGRRS